MKNSIGLEALQKACRTKKSNLSRPFYNAEMSEISKMRICNNSYCALQGQLNTHLYYVENFLDRRTAEKHQWIISMFH